MRLHNIGHSLAVVAALLVLAAAPAHAQRKTITLVTTTEAVESGVLDYLLPRFSLKTGIRVDVVSATPDQVADLGAAADVLLTDDAAAVQALGLRGTDVMAHKDSDLPIAVAILNDAQEDAAKLADWLTSDVGANTIRSFKVDGVQLYRPADEIIAVAVTVPVEGDANMGEKLALFHCGRCHVVSAKNRMGGIGSTPSFPALRAMPDWQDKFLAFWSLNPHPSFTQVDGLTTPFDPDKPPHIAPVELTIDEVDAIVAFVSGMAPKDLGGRVQSR